jgi:hypothetical protein
LRQLFDGTAGLVWNAGRASHKWFFILRLDSISCHEPRHGCLQLSQPAEDQDGHMRCFTCDAEHDGWVATQRP